MGGRQTIRILFYVEPLTELDRPLFHEAWLEFSAKLCEAVCGGGFVAQSDTLKLLTNKVLGKQATKYGFSDEFLSTIEEQDLLGVFGTDYLSAMVRGYRGELTTHELGNAATVITNALGTFVPDIVITYATAPYLKQAFPDALILHMEYGLYSRAPFPESFYLDPFGKFGNSALALFEDEIRNHQPTKAELKLVGKIRDVFLEDILLPSSPFQALSDDLKRKYDKLVLLPLQFSGHYGFDGTCPYHSQAEFLQAVAEAVPNDVGIIALPHSTAVYIGDVPDKEWLDAFFSAHPNVMMHPKLSTVLYPSQFMLSHVDAVVSVSSSIALQGMLWGTSIIAVGQSHINSIANIGALSEIDDASFTVDRDRNLSSLSWLLNHYYIPGSYFFNPDWIYSYLGRCLDKWRSGIRNLDFFEPIDHPASLAQVICDGAFRKVPIEVKQNTP